jgi:formyltetrahydrofolate deformylase
LNKYIIKILCSDKKGLVYHISNILYKNKLNIEKNSEYVDEENRKFFFRAIVFGEFDKKDLLRQLEKTLPKDASITIRLQRKKDIVIMATKESHSLGDILIKHYSGELNANILAVIANHNTLRELVEKFNIPFFHITAENKSRSEHEKKVLKTLSGYNLDYIVLAKYMRILSNDFVKEYEEKIINIHHSFLPAFIGANPYKQAYNRGVKIIGATAHFVNDNLDEGPIIHQDVIRVNHEFSWKDMQRAGREVEKAVLNYALDLVFDDRVFVYNNKTIIF